MNKRLLSKVTLNFLATSLLSSVAFSQVVKVPEGPMADQLNHQVRRTFDIPMYFNIPYSSHQEINMNESAKSGKVYVLNYKEARESREDVLGLRLIVVKGQDNRLLNSQKLAESGIFETGDVVLSFRPEWYGSLKYSHVQLGVSHAGMLYIEEKAGKKYLKNLDMPMDADHVGQGYLNSSHYQGAPFLHVVRPVGLTDEQKKNLAEWVKLLSVNGPKAYANSQIRFNQDYADPKFAKDPELGFVGDLGRLALGLPNKKYKTLTNYCSEFVWSILSLRDCDPKTTRNQFASEMTPSCVQPFFKAMPVLGNAITAKNPEDENLSVGLIDGVPLIMESLKSQARVQDDTYSTIDALIKTSVFDKAHGDPKKISSGHRAVEEAILAANPMFYQGLQQYYQLINDRNAADNPMVAGMAHQFNASQPLNYSPTSYIVHALLPNEYAIKKFGYVGTILYSKPTPGQNGKSNDLFEVLRSLK